MDCEWLAGEVEVAELVGPEATCAARISGRSAARTDAVRAASAAGQRRGPVDRPAAGLSEIVQNADGLGANQVRIFVRDTELLVAHDGRPVRLTDVMTLAMSPLTSKDDDSDATGRFGIGFMTLRRLSPVLETFCGFYRVRIGDPDVSLADPFPVPPGSLRTIGQSCVFRSPSPPMFRGRMSTTGLPHGVARGCPPRPRAHGRASV
ncbi:sacsin N-terminal ATP-binding-like domain-containing protein [Streptomyces sp. BF23-18]|uniref:sacsin N-terminal ATP-binding-like domain-containing protein n=1 Tax=Streptomyces sp. BF23-18 TaxID=3240282 RepID=UPI0034E3F2E3